MTARRSKQGFAYDPVTAIGIPNRPRGNYEVREANGDPEHTLSWSLSRVAWSVDGDAVDDERLETLRAAREVHLERGGDAH